MHNITAGEMELPIKKLRIPTKFQEMSSKVGGSCWAGLGQNTFQRKNSMFFTQQQLEFSRCAFESCDLPHIDLLFHINNVQLRIINIFELDEPKESMGGHGRVGNWMGFVSPNSDYSMSCQNFLIPTISATSAAPFPFKGSESHFIKKSCLVFFLKIKTSHSNRSTRDRSDPKVAFTPVLWFKLNAFYHISVERPLK